jgi:hypothetical protein
LRDDITDGLLDEVTPGQVFSGDGLFFRLTHFPIQRFDLI